MHPLVDAFGYENVRVDGYEADDVIATVADRAREQGYEVMIVTGDRDLFQLIQPGVRVMATSRGSPRRRSTTATPWSTATESRPSRSPTSWG